MPYPGDREGVRKARRAIQSVEAAHTAWVTVAGRSAGHGTCEAIWPSRGSSVDWPTICFVISCPFPVGGPSPAGVASARRSTRGTNMTQATASGTGLTSKLREHFGFRRFRPGSGEGRPLGAGRARHAGADADRIGQEPLLPAPGAGDGGLDGRRSVR